MSVFRDHRRAKKINSSLANIRTSRILRSALLVALVALAASADKSVAIELAEGDLIVADFGRDTIFRVDPTSGDRTIVSGSGVGSGTSLRQPRGVAVDGWGQIYVTDADSARLQVVRIDPLTGNRTLVSGGGVGVGDVFAAPFALAFNSQGELYVSDISSGLNAVFYVDIRTGDRTIVSSASVGSGPVFGNPTVMAFDAADSLLVGDQTLNGVYRVDLSTGDRTLLSGSNMGSGPVIDTPLGMDVAADGSLIVTSLSGGLTSSSSFVIEVDPATGNRMTASSSSVGSGPDFAGIRGITIDSSQNIFAVDLDLDAVFTVNRNNGARTILSDAVTGSGLSFTTPDAIASVGALDLAGDYDGDNLVAAKDYTAWRNNLGSMATLPGDVTPGIVSPDDYQIWRSNFGRFSNGAPVTQAVPEPSSVLLAAIGAMVGLNLRHRYRPVSALRRLHPSNHGGFSSTFRP